MASSGSWLLGHASWGVASGQVVGRGPGAPHAGLSRGKDLSWGLVGAEVRVGRCLFSRLKLLVGPRGPALPPTTRIPPAPVFPLQLAGEARGWGRGWGFLRLQWGDPEACLYCCCCRCCRRAGCVCVLLLWPCVSGSQRPRPSAGVKQLQNYLNFYCF